MIDMKLYESLNTDERIGYLRMIETEARGLRRVLQRQRAASQPINAETLEQQVQTVASRYNDMVTGRRAARQMAEEKTEKGKLDVE